MKKTVSIFIACMLAFAFAGCTGSQRLTNMTIIQAIGFDDTDGETVVTVQYLDFNKGTGKTDGISGQLTSTAYARGQSIEKALGSLSETLPDQLFFGQNKLIILGKSFEVKRRDDFQKFIRTKKCRVDVYLALSEGEAKKVIENHQRGERVPADVLFHQINNEKAVVTVNDYLHDEDVSLPEIEVFEDYCIVKKK